MISHFLDLLKQIAIGVIIYEPFRHDAQGMLEFQDLVHRLQEVERLGLVGRLYMQTRASHSAEYVDLVMMQGGLTVEGRRIQGQQSASD